MVAFIRKHKITCLLLLIFMYIFLGATAPFFAYKKVSKETITGFDPSIFRTGTPACDRVSLLETNESAWEERLRLLSQARERIILATFDMRTGQSTEDILSVLLHKAEEGVRIQILVDGTSGLVHMEGEDLFYALSSHPNAEIKLYNRVNPLLPWKLQGRMHDKYVIVDDTAYLLGGRNTYDYFIGSYDSKHASRDREVLVYNTAPESRVSSLYELEAYFQKIWEQEECTYFHNQEKLAEKKKVRDMRAMLEEHYQKLAADNPQLFSGDWDYTEHTYEAGSIRLISNPTHVYGKEPTAFYELTALMKEAKERVIIQSPYVVCNSYMYEQLKELKAAVPDTRILLNSIENGDNFVASSDYMRNKGDVIRTGIPLFEYDGGISTHGKSILIDDDLSIVGSYNLDLRSTYLDTELMLVIESKELNQELLGYMNALEADSRRVIDIDTYETPEHITVAEIPFGKLLALKVVGFILQPFRSLI